MSSVLDPIKFYLERFENIDSDKITESHKKAISDFSKLKFPDKKTEAWKYTNINALLSIDFELVKEAGTIDTTELDFCSGIKIVIIDGIFSKKHSSIGNMQFTESGIKLDYVENTFSLLNKAFYKKPVVFNLSNESENINIIHISTQTKKVAFPRIEINCSKGSSGKIIEYYISQNGSEYFNNALTLINVGDESKFEYIKIQNESKDSFSLTNTFVTLGQNVEFKAFSFNKGAKLSRNDITVSAYQEGSHIVLNGLYILDGTQETNNYTFIDHGAPRCESHQIYTGVLDDKSKAVFRGRIKIQRGAEEVNSNQLNKNMLLSDKANIITQPQLEIDCDNVKCNHGATSGEISEEEIFYLNTRGLNKKMAREMLASAFAHEPIKIFSSYVQEQVEKFMK